MTLRSWLLFIAVAFTGFPVVARPVSRPVRSEHTASFGANQNVRTISTIMGIPLRPVIAVPSDMTLMGVQDGVDSIGETYILYEAISSRPPAAIYKQYQAIYGGRARWRGKHQMPDGSTEYRIQLFINSGASLINTSFTISNRASQERFDRAGRRFTAKTVMLIWVALTPNQVKAYQTSQPFHDGISVPIPTQDR